jgi:hypothetical protein
MQILSAAVSLILAASIGAFEPPPCSFSHTYTQIEIILVTAAPTSTDLELRDDNNRIPAAQALANAIGGKPINKCESICVALRNSINVRRPILW